MSLNPCSFCERAAKNIYYTLSPSNKLEGVAALSIPVALVTIPQVGLFVSTCYGGYKFISKKWMTHAQSGPFSARDSSLPIYVSTVPNPTSQMLDPFAKKIESLRNQSVLGIGTVQNKATRAMIPVYIEFKEISDVAIFRVRRLDNDQEMGAAKVLLVANQGNFYGNKSGASITYQNENEVYYGNEGAKLDKIFLDDIDNDKKGLYRNVGYILIKSIHQFYKNKFEARMNFISTLDAGGFYYKLGFRSTNSAVNQALASGTKKGGALFLPEWARKQWQNQIEENPIGFPELLKPSL